MERDFLLFCCQAVWVSFLLATRGHEPGSVSAQILATWCAGVVRPIVCITCLESVVLPARYSRSAHTFLLPQPFPWGSLDLLPLPFYSLLLSDHINLCHSTSHFRPQYAAGPMVIVRTSHVLILNDVVDQCMLPSPIYSWEFHCDERLLVGVELLIPSAVNPGQLEPIFFWCPAYDRINHAHEAVAKEAVRFLQARYGFAVHDYNFAAMIAYRRIARDAIDAAMSASSYVARFRSSYAAIPSHCDDILRICSSL
uniref:Uncharacterized protein n=1 Tax=Oryza brachyantha TaxID=4533 RepID=J3LW78_ORYBR